MALTSTIRVLLTTLELLLPVSRHISVSVSEHLERACYQKTLKAALWQLP
jgi:hypothetical protein